ncbi:hypothetical protein ACQEVY_14235 [Streptomyces sp. CA-288835]|uniref:hypothetical protein n=1 Tax=Streptomyces sp. CA-288835 TaxID=3240069 RepID=UPI003D8A239D
MRDRPFVRLADTGFSVRFVGAQRDLLDEVLTFVSHHPSPEIRTGWDKDRLMVLADSIGGEERTYSVEELHVLHAALVSVCSMFASEESFHIRIGFFRENALAVASGLVKAVEDARETG